MTSAGVLVFAWFSTTHVSTTPHLHAQPCLLYEI